MSTTASPLACWGFQYRITPAKRIGSNGVLPAITAKYARCRVGSRAPIRTSIAAVRVGEVASSGEAVRPATFALIHAAGDGAWSWHLVADELQGRGHEGVSLDLPADDESADLWDYADAAVREIGDRKNLVVVGHSFGAFTAPLICERVPVELLVLLAPMIPKPGEPPMDWWANSGQTQAQRDAGTDGLSDTETYYHDVPPELAAEAIRRERNHPSDRAYREPWPLEAWPEVPTRVLLCTNDRLLPAAWIRGLARDRLHIEADEIESGHCVNLSRPRDLAERLEAYWADLAG
jgi:pimeloyl-ACP methyl ester carboxylesterase